MPMQINSDAFAVLKKALADKTDLEPWRGKNPIDWCKNVTGSCNRASLLRAGPVPMDRKRLFDFCAEPNADARDIFVAVFAWGGMRADHGRRAWLSAKKWMPVIDWLKAACPNRREAYRSFAQLRARNCLPGVGPAFFTKVIFFVRPDLSGYIMDQWTARSINLLYGSTVQLTYGQMVAENDPDVYDEFCRKVEHLAGRLGCSPQDTERAIFSFGGKYPGSWRKYVKASINPLPDTQ